MRLCAWRRRPLKYPQGAQAYSRDEDSHTAGAGQGGKRDPGYRIRHPVCNLPGAGRGKDPAAQRRTEGREGALLPRHLRGRRAGEQGAAL